MKRRTFLIGGVTAAASGSALLGTGALSKTDAQRSVTIETVGDRDAPLRLAYRNQSAECEQRVELVELTNHLEEEITDVSFSYDASSTGLSLESHQIPNTLSVGESAAVTAQVDCDTEGPSRAILTFDIEITGENQTVSVADRELRLTCRCPSDDDEENGSGEQSGEGTESGSEGNEEPRAESDDSRETGDSGDDGAADR